MAVKIFMAINPITIKSYFSVDQVPIFTLKVLQHFLYSKAFNVKNDQEGDC